MISQLVGKIADIFDKDYLLGSVLPALLFLSAAGATFAFVVRPAVAWTQIKGSSVLEETTLVALLFAVALLAFSYLLNALRPLFLRLWSGVSGLFLLEPFHILGRAVQRRAYRRLYQQSLAASTYWSKTLEQLRAEIQKLWTTGQKKAPPGTVEHLLQLVGQLHPTLGEATVNELRAAVVEAYRTYTNTTLAKVYEKLDEKLRELSAWEALGQRQALSSLDRRFGKIESLTPTELGNVIQAYNDYPYERYCMEGAVFWPRLQEVISPELRGLTQNQQTLLDFSLTTASLALVYGALALVAGPWLWTAPWLWLALGVAGVLVAYLFYRLGCVAAWRLGDFVRASFDLFRLKLLESLGSEMPKTVREEQALWRSLSQLLVYSGDVTRIAEIKLRVSEQEA